VKLLLTILNSEGNAVDVVYCGRDWGKARLAWDAARDNPKWRGLRLRRVVSADDGSVDTIVDCHLY
jgi:hypothetical protein